MNREAEQRVAKRGILKETTGDENIPDISENELQISREKIEGTPFEIIYQESIGYWLSMGIFRLSEPKETAEEIKLVILDKGWDTIINVMCAIIAGRDMELIKESQKNQFETPKNN